MTAPRVPIFERLPAIHRIRDAEQKPPDQLRAFAGLLERALGEVHADIERLYHDLFIDTCAEWVIPYLADLLGTSHLAGDPWTLRADVADTIALRRRKGTRGGIELLVYDLTGWAVHTVLLRDRLVWSQHLNHQRPDAGGRPPLAEPGVGCYAVPRGGTVTLRDPATLSLLDTPFDPFAHVPDLRPPGGGAVRHNLPNLAIFTWRLAPYAVVGAMPVGSVREEARAGAAPALACFEVHPTGDPVVLFNRYRHDPDAEPLRLGAVDAMPGPIPAARLTTAAHAGRPEAYVSVQRFDPADAATLEAGDTALCVHVPHAAAPATAPWTFRGADLCNWEAALARPIAAWEIAIDPGIGRIAIGAPSRADAEALIAEVRLSYTYGAVGPIGAHPVSRDATAPTTVHVPGDVATLAEALADASAEVDEPLVIQIDDSRTYDLDPDDVDGAIDEGGPTLVLGRTVILRAADHQRPVVRLARPLAVRPAALDERVSGLRLRLEGIYLTRGADFPVGLDAALIRRVALHALELDGCTLDPGGALARHGTARAPVRLAIAVAEPYGFSAEDEARFDQVPELHVRRCVTGPIRADAGYRLFLTDSIVDAGTGPYEDAATAAYAITGATGEPAAAWGPPVQLAGVTCFGRVRVRRAAGQGGVFAQPLEVLDHQHGCLRHCWFAPLGNRLPQRHACVFGDTAHLRFTSEAFGRPGYGQLADAADWRIRDRGPDDDAMGATGFLRASHRLRNLHIRLRELMPVGIRPLLVPVT